MTTEMNLAAPELASADKKNAPPILADHRGLELRTLDDYWRFSGIVYSSGCAPKGMAREMIMLAVQMGAEVGMTPMASIQNIAVINGRPSIWGDAMLGVCRASGAFDEKSHREWVEGDGEKMVAHVTVRRIGGEPHTVTFSVDDAKRAGLWGKSGPWTTNPQRMLIYRARAFACRDKFPDVLRGFKVAEEVMDHQYADSPAPKAAGPLPKSLDEVVEKATPAALPAGDVPDGGEAPAGKSSDYDEIHRILMSELTPARREELKKQADVKLITDIKKWGKKKQADFLSVLKDELPAEALATA